MTRLLGDDVSGLLTPVDGHDDLMQFRYDFSLEGKSLEDQVVTETEDGDLIIEGYAAVFEGIDRQGENFAPGAFDRGIKSFLAGSAPLCFNHKHDYVLGKVLDLREEEGKGLYMKARVDGATAKHPILGTLYQQIKKGTINALSVGGYFKRALTEAGRRIVDMDFTEISTTATPVHPGPSFAVVAGKALTSDIQEVKQIEVEGEIRESDLEQINWMIAELNGIFDRIQDGLNKRKTDNPDQSA